MQKLKILADCAKYDVSCSSSGASRNNNGRLGNAHAAGICHTWAADGRCVSLLKVLFTNKCVYNCEYCVSRRDSDYERVSFEPEELAELTMEFYRRNYIEGLFLSSAVEVSPDYTAERILKCLQLLRYQYGFAGYIHAKIIPGVSPEILHQIGLVADRLSVNIEMPTSKSLSLLAPQKKPKQIFAPMRQITNTLIETNSLVGPGNMFKGQKLNTAEHYLGGDGTFRAGEAKASGANTDSKFGSTAINSHSGVSDSAFSDDANTRNRFSGSSLPEMWDPAYEPEHNSKVKEPSIKFVAGSQAKKDCSLMKRGEFAAAGQTTQMIIGAGGESDQNILTTSQNLYRAFKMKRVYYSAYIPALSSPILPAVGTPVPLAREHRIYQADWLLRFYGFSVDEIFKGSDGNLDPDLDPKVMWAIRNLDKFPIEVNKASYAELMRIPGIGDKSAKRIIRQRKYRAVKFDELKKMGVVMKRAKYFLLCCGRYYGDRKFEPETIRTSLLQLENGLQMSLFDSSGQLAIPGGSAASALDSKLQQFSGGTQGLSGGQNRRHRA